MIVCSNRDNRVNYIRLYEHIVYRKFKLNNGKQMMTLLQTIPRLQIRHAPILVAFLISSAGQASDRMLLEPVEQVNQTLAHVSESQKKEALSALTQTPECPVVSSQNWSASISKNDQGKSMISIKGNIELPNPGYAVTLEEQVSDRPSQAKQHFRIKAERLNGFYIQAITPMTLEHFGPVTTSQYTSIIIHCGEQIITTIEKVHQAS